MKKSLLISVILMLSLQIFAQVPQFLNYQAVLRDGEGPLSVIKKSSVAVIVNIIKDSPEGSSVFEEVHSTSVNDFGLFTIQIGSVNTDDFTSIDWSSGTYYLNVNVNGTDFGTSQLLSVPYALYANKAGNQFSGSYNDLADVPTEFNPTTHNHTTDEVTGLTTVAETGEYSDLNNIPTEFNPIVHNHSADEITVGVFSVDRLPVGTNSDQVASGNHTHTESDIVDLTHYTDADIDGNESSFSGWDKDVTDDFDGNYSSLTNAPTNVSAFNNDAGYLSSEIDGDLTNEIQSLSLNSNILSLSKDPSTINLGSYLDNTDNQALLLNDDVLTIENGNGSVDLTKYINDADSDTTNELQVISISNDTISLSNGGYVKLPNLGPQFIPKIVYQIGGMGSPYTIDISSDIPVDCSSLICVVEFLNQWTVSYYGGSYLEAYYGDQTEDEKIRIETHIEDTSNSNYYSQSGQSRVQVIIPVVNGNQIILNHIGVKTLEVNGYYR